MSEGRHPYPFQQPADPEEAWGPECLSDDAGLSDPTFATLVEPLTECRRRLFLKESHIEAERRKESKEDDTNDPNEADDEYNLPWIVEKKRFVKNAKKPVEIQLYPGGPAIDRRLLPGAEIGLEYNRDIKLTGFDTHINTPEVEVYNPFEIEWTVIDPHSPLAPGRSHWDKLFRNHDESKPGVSIYVPKKMMIHLQRMAETYNVLSNQFERVSIRRPFVMN